MNVLYVAVGPNRYTAVLACFDPENAAVRLEDELDGEGWDLTELPIFSDLELVPGLYTWKGSIAESRKGLRTRSYVGAWAPMDEDDLCALEALQVVVPNTASVRMSRLRRLSREADAHVEPSDVPQSRR